jgi:hypothetical protein
MSDARVDDLLRDLEAELSIEPPPQLVARVRARIDDRSRSRTLIPAWTAGIALTLLMTAIALGIAPDRQTGSSSSAPSRTSPSHVARVTEMPAPLAESRAWDERVPGAPVRRPGRAPSVAAVPTPEIPVKTVEVLVPLDQATALRRILVAMRTGRSPVPPATPQAVDAEGRLPAPEAIGIPQIMIQPITPPTDSGRNKER